MGEGFSVDKENFRTGRYRMTCYGEIFPVRTLFFREAAGEATDSEGNKYEVSTNIAEGVPIVHSRQSKKWFVLPWKDIIKLAVEAGIDKSD